MARENARAPGARVGRDVIVTKGRIVTWGVKMIDIQRTDGRFDWGDDTLVCSACGRRQATETAPGGAPLCVPCNKLLQLKGERKHGVWKVKRIFDAVMLKLTGGDA